MSHLCRPGKSRACQHGQLLLAEVCYLYTASSTRQVKRDRPFAVRLRLLSQPQTSADLLICEQVAGQTAQHDDRLHFAEAGGICTFCGFCVALNPRERSETRDMRWSDAGNASAAKGQRLPAMLFCPGSSFAATAVWLLKGFQTCNTTDFCALYGLPLLLFGADQSNFEIACKLATLQNPTQLRLLNLCRGTRVCGRASRSRRQSQP